MKPLWIAFFPGLSRATTAFLNSCSRDGYIFAGLDEATFFFNVGLHQSYFVPSSYREMYALLPRLRRSEKYFLFSSSPLVFLFYLLDL